MKGISTWSYHPYQPYFFETGDIYINRICPYETSIHLEWQKDKGTEYQVYYRKRDCGAYLLAGKTYDNVFDIIGLTDDYEYEFYVQAEEKKSRVRLARCGKPVGNIVTYLHPEDKAYSFSGQYLCSPSLVWHPDGFLLASMDLFEARRPQNLTLIYRSDDEGETWHYVSELYPCFWGKMFIHKGELYMLSVSTEYGDLLIGKSTDGGKTFGAPTVLLRGACHVEEDGIHKNPQNMIYHNGRIYGTLEWGAWTTGGHAPMVMSCDVDDDLLVAENWHFSEPVKYNPDWEGLPKGNSFGNLEGTLVVFPDGHLYNVMRYDMRYFNPDRGLIMAYRVNEEDPDAPLQYSHTIEFMGNNAKFMIKKDEVSGKYYTIATRQTEERSIWARNLLSLMSSDDMKQWNVVCDLFDYRDRDPQYTGFQYVDFEIEGNDIIYLCRTAINRAHNFHDSNYSTFHRIKDFREIADIKKDSGSEYHGSNLSI